MMMGAQLFVALWHADRKAKYGVAVVCLKAMQQAASVWAVGAAGIMQRHVQ